MRKRTGVDHIVIRGRAACGAGVFMIGRSFHSPSMDSSEEDIKAFESTLCKRCKKVFAARRRRKNA